MTAPSPTTPWVPLWSFQDPSVVPTPVNGKWLKGGPGGAMTWSDIPGYMPPAPDLSYQGGWNILGVDVSYGSGWENYSDPYGPVRFRRLTSGLVVMSGLMRNGGVGVDAFILPAGYRPAPQSGGGIRHHIFACATGGGPATEAIRVYSNGEVVPQTSYTVPWVDLSGVMFWAGG